MHEQSKMGLSEVNAAKKFATNKIHWWVIAIFFSSYSSFPVKNFQLKFKLLSLINKRLYLKTKSFLFFILQSCHCISSISIHYIIRFRREKFSILSQGSQVITLWKCRLDIQWWLRRLKQLLRFPYKKTSSYTDNLW